MQTKTGTTKDIPCPLEFRTAVSVLLATAEHLATERDIGEDAIMRALVATGASLLHVRIGTERAALTLESAADHLRHRASKAS